MEVPGSHAVYISRPKDVAMLIERAAKEIGLKEAGRMQ